MTDLLYIYQNSRPYLLHQITRLTQERDDARSKLAQARDALQEIDEMASCSTEECGTGTCSAVHNKASEALDITR